MPDKILSDQGTNCQSELISEVLELMDIQRSKTTPYHPQCDGLSERFNRTMKAMLSSCVNKEGDDWDSKLQYIQFAYNTAVHATNECTPFKLVYGGKPKGPAVRQSECGPQPNA